MKIKDAGFVLLRKLLWMPILILLHEALSSTPPSKPCMLLNPWYKTKHLGFELLNLVDENEFSAESG